MVIRALKCPNCGGVIDLFDDKQGICPFCDNFIMDIQDRQTEYANVLGKIQVEGFASVDNLIIRVRRSLHERDFSRAEEYVNRILDLDAGNLEAINLLDDIFNINLSPLWSMKSKQRIRRRIMKLHCL